MTENWPDEEAPRLVALAADLIREANRLTTRHDGYRAPADVAATVTALTDVARAVPQLLLQAASWLDVEHAAHRVGTDDGTPPAEAVAAAVRGIHGARAAAGFLTTSLVAAGAAPQHLTRLDAPAGAGPST